MAFAVPLVRKDYQLYALNTDSGKKVVRVMNGSKSSRNLLQQNRGRPNRKRSLSDPTLSNAARVAALRSIRNTAQPSLDKRRGSTGAMSGLANLLRRRGGEEKKSRTKSESQSEDLKKTEPLPIKKFNGVRRSSSDRHSSLDAGPCTLTAIREDDEEEEEDCFVRSMSESPEKETRPESPDEGICADGGSEEVVIESLSPDSGRKWRAALMDRIRSRLHRIERCMGQLNPAN